MANKSLTDLTARTATADSDLIHVNSGGTDYKQTKARFCNDIVQYIDFANTSLLTGQCDTLGSTVKSPAYFAGKINSYGHQSACGTPENNSYHVLLSIYSGNYHELTITDVDTGAIWRKLKINGTWQSSWVMSPTRNEITSLNNSLANSFTWKSSTEEASVATGTSWVKALQFSVTQSQFIRAFLRYSATPPSEIMITSGTALGAVPVLAHAIAPSSGATAHPLYTPSVLLSPGTYYLYAKSTASGTNGVGIQRTNI